MTAASLVTQGAIDAFRRVLVGSRLVRDPGAASDWLAGLTESVDARIDEKIDAIPDVAAVRASVAQTGAFSLAAGDTGATDDLAGTYTVTVPAAATLGDPWSYDGLVTSGVVTFAGGQSSTPVTASGGGTPVRMYVANGKVFLRSGSGATVTRVA
jgi:hypothetical protein